MAVNTAGQGVTNLNIGGGTLIIRGADQSAAVADWITNGYLSAYGHTPGTNGYEIIIDTTTVPGGTMLTAVPEPATALILSLGALTILGKRKH